MPLGGCHRIYCLATSAWLTPAWPQGYLAPRVPTYAWGLMYARLWSFNTQNTFTLSDSTCAFRARCNARDLDGAVNCGELSALLRALHVMRAERFLREMILVVVAFVVYYSPASISIPVLVMIGCVRRRTHCLVFLNRIYPPPLSRWLNS